MKLSWQLFRRVLSAFVLFCAVAACSPASDSPATGSVSETRRTASQDTVEAGDITSEKVVRDVVGRVVKITEAFGDGPATEWTFDADEPKQVEILERDATQAIATVTVFMTTRNNPVSDEDTVQVTGKLKLLYEREGSKWILKGIENLTFHYTIGVST